MLVIFTIGHSTRTWLAFLELLRAYDIKRVIDVRSIPRSRHNPQFNRETLSAKLRSARIGYVHSQKLGGLRHARVDSPNMGWRNTSFRGFADYMQTAEFEAGLERLIKLAKQKRSALMCVPKQCLGVATVRSLLTPSSFVAFALRILVAGNVPGFTCSLRLDVSEENALLIPCHGKPHRKQMHSSPAARTRRRVLD
jgi:hypothetical protein